MRRILIAIAVLLGTAPLAPAQTADEIRTAQALLAVLGQYEGTADGTLNAADRRRPQRLPARRGSARHRPPRHGHPRRAHHSRQRPPRAKGLGANLRRAAGEDQFSAPSRPSPTAAYSWRDWTESTGAGNGDGWLLRLDAEGRVLWERTFGATERDGFSRPRAPRRRRHSRGGRDGEHRRGGLGRLAPAPRCRGPGPLGAHLRRAGGGRASPAIAPLPDGGILVAGTHGEQLARAALTAGSCASTPMAAFSGSAPSAGRGGTGSSALAPLPDGSILLAGWTESSGAGGSGRLAPPPRR